MSTSKSVLWLAAAIAAVAFTGAAAQAKAEVSLGIDLNAAPVCPYGYYDHVPYDCAPYGYYGPEWFAGGAFVGAGPWYHGHDGFLGHVDHHLDPHHGYDGPRPARGELPHPSHSFDHIANFHGTELRDGRGHGFAMGGHGGGSMGGHEGGHSGGGHH
jgi:hypothetical protein